MFLFAYENCEGGTEIHLVSRGLLPEKTWEVSGKYTANLYETAKSNKLNTKTKTKPG